MTDEILDALGRTEHLLTTYLRDLDAGIGELARIEDIDDLRMTTAGLLEFVRAQYVMQWVEQVALGNGDVMNQTLTAIHIGFMELRDQREQELRGNNQPIPEEGPQ